MFPIIHVGPLALQVPGLVLLLGIWLGLTLAERYVSRRGIGSNQLYNIIFIGLISGLIGARLVYVLRYYEIFASNPVSIISLNPGLLDPSGGGAFALIAVLIYGQRYHLKLWDTLDALTPFLAVVGISIGLAHISSGTAFGIETDLPWAIDIWGAPRHPTQIYETLAATLILIITWPGYKVWNKLQPGVYFLIFAIMTASTRLFLEAFRDDSVLVAGGFRSAQIISWIIIALCLYLIWRQQNNRPFTKPDST